MTNAGLTLWAAAVARHEATVSDPPRSVLENPYLCRPAKAVAPLTSNAEDATSMFTNIRHHPASLQRTPLPPSPRTGSISLRPLPGPSPAPMWPPACYSSTQHEPRGPSITAKSYCERYQPDARELLAPLLARRIIYMGTLRRQLAAGELDQDLDEWQRMELDTWVCHWLTLPDEPIDTMSVASPSPLCDASGRANRLARSISPSSASDKRYTPQRAAQMFDDDPENRGPVLCNETESNSDDDV